MQIMTDDELVSCKPGEVFFFDIEVYPNFFLVAFLHEVTGKIVNICAMDYSPLNTRKLRWIMNRFKLVSFNGINFDIPILEFALNKCSDPGRLKYECDYIIKQSIQSYMFYKEHNLKPPKYNHIDLIEVAPLKASLKTYGARLGCEKIQDLPYSPDEDLSYEQMGDVVKYCHNDLKVTKLLYESLKDAIELREELGQQYGIDLRSKSNAQCAEAIIRKLTGVVPTGVRSGQFYYNPPAYLEFKSPELQILLDEIITSPFVVYKEGKIIAPSCLQGKRKIEIAGKSYTVGIGGLHSNEKSIYYISNDKTQIFDYDVASYYPRAIDTMNIIPPAIGVKFLDIYRGLIQSRLEDKKNKLTRRSNAKKIIINGIFGKMRSKFSIFFHPPGFIQVTLTGQLILLMLIEDLEFNNIPVLSANTDGIVIACQKSRIAELDIIIKNWEAKTSFEMEGSKYKGIYFRDVNNYIAIKEAGEVKTKGAFSWQELYTEESLSKNPKANIIQKAVVAFLKDNMPIEDTICHCPDILDFCIVRHVTGGGEIDARYLGKTVRFYYSTHPHASQIRYVKNGNKVPDADGVMPLMDLSTDCAGMYIDYDRYIQEANEALIDLGVYPKPKKVKVARKRKGEV